MKQRLALRPLPEPTLIALEYHHPVLFRQCTRIFGRHRAGRMVLDVHRQGAVR